MGELVECFAWSPAENLDRDECEPCPKGCQDWNGECSVEDGFPARDYHPQLESDDPAIESPVEKFARIMGDAEREMSLLGTWDDEDKP